MYDYGTLKRDHGTRVSQTIDSPITIFDFWELSEAFAGLVVVLIFGVIFYSWGLMTLLLALVLGAGPVIRSRNHRGIFLHWPYRYWRIQLPGLVNPRCAPSGKKKYSD
jgi:hypothetical protein